VSPRLARALAAAAVLAIAANWVYLVVREAVT
jgi:hypothetical protein